MAVQKCKLTLFYTLSDIFVPPKTINPNISGDLGLSMRLTLRSHISVSFQPITPILGNVTDFKALFLKVSMDFR